MKRGLAGQVDDLYRLPLGEFTPARNALAKSLEGAARKDVASLVKPSVPMWVINQLYWKDDATYNALIDASEKLRAAHRAALTGRKADTRQADQLHRTTVEKAFAKAIGIAEKGGVRVTDAVRDTIRRTLAALPGTEPPGRLTRPPEPAGFSLLTGITPRVPTVRPVKAPARETRAAKDAERRAREEAAALRKAQQTALKQQEKARKEQEKRERDIRKAEEALRDAERRLAELKR